jgi:cell division protein FtsI (penicillin-binding protein 3)
MAQRVDPNQWRGTIGRRTRFVIAGVLLWAAAVEARLVYWQVVQHDAMVTEASEQQSREVTLLAPRGEILDRHGALLAYSVDLDTIGADPRQAGDPREAVAKLCAALGDCTRDEVRTLVQRFRSGRGYVYVRRKVTPEEATRVRDLKLPWIVLHKEPRRYYPNRSLAAHVLGYVGKENDGLGGLEATYDAAIRGRAGTMLVQRDNKGRAFSSTVGEPPVPGASLELSLDRYLQYVAERELRAGVAEHRARGGAVVIMDPYTGEILAIANEPTFNPNVYTQAGPDQWRNRAVQDIYEPGSTFKMVTASAALETGAMSADDLVNTGDGVFKLGARRVTEYEGHRYGVLSLTDVMVKSSNVGAIMVGFKLGARRLGEFVKAFGFGTRLSPDFPGENAGMVWAPERWSDSSLMSVSMGYEIGVTPLQMAAAASTIANGGELVKPRVVRAVIDGNRRTPVRRQVLRRVISPQTAASLVGIMEAVVERGTAKAARIEGYGIAGKTGTAAKLVNRYYSKTDYNASFVGFLPSRAPALTILVVIDTPDRSVGGYAGGVVAAPIFHRIAEAALRYLGLPPSVNPLPPLVVTGEPKTLRVAGPVGPLLIAPVAGPLAEGQLRLPELRGLSGREAMRALARLGIGARITGDGLVVDQFPLPGTPVDPGAWCRLSLSRTTVQPVPGPRP